MDLDADTLALRHYRRRVADLYRAVLEYLHSLPLRQIKPYTGFWAGWIKPASASVTIISKAEIKHPLIVPHLTPSEGRSV